MASDPCIVQAIFSFKGTNNDELRFKKGDKITITQKEEGGWWEGTLGDKTGWFPNNYVKEIKDVTLSPISPVSQQRQYRAVVLNDLIDSERAHVTELQGLVKTFLKPLEKSNILTTDEYKQLIGNINEVLDTHQKLLELLEESEKIASAEQRVGKLFLTWAPKIKGVHQAYCSTHPRAVCVLDLHKDELASYMESCGAATPGLLVLTTGLSKPFRRLDKYSGMLQELERHVEINHPDRGDIQRSVAVYKDIAATCAATRRQKELELQVLTGPVRGWEGQSLAQLGDIIHMGSVAVGPQHQDRYLVLFPNNLLVLSVSQRMSAFIYEGKLPLTGITINRLDDTESCKNAFEVSGPMIEKIIAICQSKEEANNWVDLLRQHTKGHQKSPPPITLGETAPTPPPHLDRRGYSVRSSIFNFSYTPPYKTTLPPYFYPPASPYSTLTKSFYRLVKEQVITRRLLKRLLYPEYSNLHKYNLSSVKKRKHKSVCYIRTDSNSEDSDSEDNKLHRQNAIIRNSDSNSSSSGSVESNPFGFVRYFNPENSPSETNNMDSFIDHGENIEQPVIHESSAAQLINQISQESSDCGAAKPYMACEDLLNLDQSIEIDTFGQQTNYAPRSHQSLPNIYVANKFSKSSLTRVYIPQWQSNSDSHLASRSITRSKTDSSEDSSNLATTSCVNVDLSPTIDYLAPELNPSRQYSTSRSRSRETNDNLESISRNLKANTYLVARSSDESSQNIKSHRYIKSSSKDSSCNSQSRSRTNTIESPNRSRDTTPTDIKHSSSRSISRENSSRGRSITRAEINLSSSRDNSSNLESRDTTPSRSITRTEIHLSPRNISRDHSNTPSRTDLRLISNSIRENNSIDSRSISRENSCTPSSHRSSRGRSISRTEIHLSSRSISRDNSCTLSNSNEVSTSRESSCTPSDNNNECVSRNTSRNNSCTPSSHRRDTTSSISNQSAQNQSSSRSISSRTDSLLSSRSINEENNDSNSDGSTTTHSSCFEIPVNPIPAPDTLTAEILYNSELLSSDSSKGVIKPPFMFRNLSQCDQLPCSSIKISSNDTTSESTSEIFSENIEETDSSSHPLADISVEPHLNLRLSNVSFKHHSINSDKPKRRSSTHDASLEYDQQISSNINERLREDLNERTNYNRAGNFNRRSDECKGAIRRSVEQCLRLRKERKTSSLRKCVSYHYLQLTNPVQNCSQYCRYCTDQYCSRRSSDSGMAGSCTLHSPDLAQTFQNHDLPDMYDCLQDLSEPEAHDYEAQCRCTSPFGSTPRTSCQASTSDNILTPSRDSTTSVTSSSSDMSPFPPMPNPWESENQIYAKLMSMKEEQKRPEFLDKEQQWNPNNAFKSRSCGNLLNLPQEDVPEERQEQEVFRSGLYAHWWMKAKLPTAVIRGILEESSSADVTTSNDPDCKPTKSKHKHGK